MGRKRKHLLLDEEDPILKTPTKKKRRKRKKKRGPKPKDCIKGYKRITVDELKIEAAQRLAVDVVKSAIDDYRDYSKKLSDLKKKARLGLIARDIKYYHKLGEYRGEIKACLNFFFSERFEIFCTLDPQLVVEKLDKELEEYERKRDSK